MEQEKQDQQSNQQDQPIIVQTTWAKAFSKVGVTAVVVFGIIYIVTQCMRTPTEALKGIAKGFNSGEIVTEFRDYVTKVRGMNHLQVAALESTDTFSKVDSKNVFWNLIGLPDVIVEIQAPVEYTFYLNLKEKWTFKWQEEEQNIIVVAPKIQSNTPAIDVSNMKFVKEEGSVLRDEEDVKEKLKTELSERVKTMAEEKVPLIREIARNEVRQYIDTWFIKVRFKDSEVKPHVYMVYFADEDVSFESSTSFNVEDNL